MHSKPLISFLLALCCIHESLVYCLTIDQVETLKTYIRDSISEASSTLFGNDTSILIAGLVQLPFHDCVGGCDGCINKNNPVNTGVVRYVDAIEGYYQAIQSQIEVSRADFWNLAGMEAINMARDKELCKGCSPEPLPFVFKYGRADCASGGPYSTYNLTFPRAKLSGKHTVDFFKKEFGMTARQIVAIMGAHTLGRAHHNISGFDGKWVDGHDKFNNDYYIALLNETLQWRMVQKEPSNNRAGRWQWENKANPGKEPVMMFNIEMGLVLDLEGQINVTTGEVTGCTYSNCSLNTATYPYIVEFASSNSVWLTAFAEAYDIMSARGYSSTDLRLPIAAVQDDSE